MHNDGSGTPIPERCDVRARARSTSASALAADEGFGIIPSPPASETAAASAGVPTGPAIDAQLDREPTADKIAKAPRAHSRRPSLGA